MLALCTAHSNTGEKEFMIMTSRELIEAALRQEETPRVPVFLRDLTLGLDVSNFTTPEVFVSGPNGYDAAKSATAVIRTQQLLEQDCVVGCIHSLGTGVDALGGRLEYPELGIPFIAAAPLADPEQIDKARLAVSQREPKLQEIAHSYALVTQAIGARVAIAANVEGPITQAGVLRGLSALLVDMMRQPERAQAVVDVAVEMSCQQIRAFAAAGAHFVFIAAASDGPAASRPQDYLQYTIPGLARMVATAREAGLSVVFHPHGPFTQERFHRLVDAAIDTGIVGFQFGEDNDLALARKRWGRRICILGGPDIPTVLLPGPPDRIAAATHNIIREVGAEGFILMPSCSVHRGFPISHLQAMIAAAHSHSN
jgi:MtaA/CmuA family methyltransferase